MMLRDIAGWLLYSPRRVTMVFVPAVVATGLLGMLAVHGTADGPVQGHPAASGAKQRAPERQAPHSRPVSTERTATSRELLRTARRFLDAYVVPAGATAPSHVTPHLRRLVTPALWRGLELAEPSTLPRGPVEKLTVEQSGAFSGLVTVDLDTGPQLSVTVVAWQQGWRVSDVRPGDAG
jgi:hypothetical protein